jgi:hypothetical protein
MGYSTDFIGHVTVTPPLNQHEIAYLRKFAETRRMARANGPYFVDGTGYFGQGHDADIEDFGRSPDGQPGLWCQWVATDDGTGIEWNGIEKFRHADAWMAYLIATFLKPGAAVQKELAAPVPGRVYSDDLRHFTFDHQVSGVIEAQGEDPEDRWDLVVQANAVSVRRYEVTPESDSSALLDRVFNGHHPDPRDMPDDATAEDRAAAALGIAAEHGSMDDAHRWVIDQMVRALLGPDYEAFVDRFDASGYGLWDEGTAP